MHGLFLVPLFLGFAGASQHDTPPADAMTKVNFLVGDWQGKQTFMIGNGDTMVGEAVDHAEYAVGNRFLSERLSTTLPNRPPTDTRHMLGFDKASGEYKAYWFNDTSSLPMILTGKVDGSKLVLTSDAAAGPGGPPSHLRFTYDGSTADHLVLTFEMEAAGKWRLLFKSEYTKIIFHTGATTGKAKP